MGAAFLFLIFLLYGVVDKLYGKKENAQTTQDFIEFIKQNNITIESKDSQDYQKHNLLNQAYDLSPRYTTIAEDDIAKYRKEKMAVAETFWHHFGLSTNFEK